MPVLTRDNHGGLSLHPSGNPSLLHRSGLILTGGVILVPTDEKFIAYAKKENPGESRRGFPVSFRSRYFFFFFFLNDLWHAPHCLPIRPTAFLMAAGPPL